MKNPSSDADLIPILLPYIYPNAHIAVACSGGIDSIVLLHLLQQIQKTYALSVRAIHVNHGLNPQAKDWAHQVQKLCAQWQIPCQIESIEHKPEKNIEASARKCRYAILAKALKHHEVLMTAHHLDDQAETFLLALKRGSGPTGLASMPARKPFASSELIRPLLSVSRAIIDAYAQKHELLYVTDNSNWNTDFDRNFLRHKVVPILRQRWPQFTAMVARSAELCATENALLQEFLLEILPDYVNTENALCLPALASLSEAKRNGLLRTWISQQRLPLPSRKQLYLLWHTVGTARQDANPHMKLDGYCIRRFRDHLYITATSTDTIIAALCWDMTAPLILPNQFGTLYAVSDKGDIRKPIASEQVKVRFGTNDSVAIVGRCGSRSLKKLWQEFAIPSWQRRRIPLLYYNDQLIAAVGVFITKEGQGNDLRLLLESSIINP